MGKMGWTVFFSLVVAAGLPAVIGRIEVVSVLKCLWLEIRVDDFAM